MFLTRLLAPSATRLFSTRTMTTIAPGVEFNTLAREWRFKWSTDNDKASLAAGQAALMKVLPAIKALEGVSEVQRVVCGGCLDFKVITSMPAEAFEKNGDALTELEEAFLKECAEIEGVSTIETQTYTLEKL
jgi:hypothetical protein